MKTHLLIDVVIMVLWTLKVFRDSIQFGKTGRNVNELWHIADLTIHGITAILLFVQFNVPYWHMFIVMFYGFLSFEIVYPFFRSINTSRWDDVLIFPAFFQELMGVKHEEDD